MILGVDIGGTFTDFVLLDSAGQVRIYKLLTSTPDPSRACLQGIVDLDTDPETTVIHGTTVGTNALLERRGARTALIATNGFGDVLEIGRQTRRELYALHPTRPEPLVPKCWRFELPERVDRHGAVLHALDLDATDAVVCQLISEGIESVAICFLFSFVNPRHERQVGERIMAMADKAAPAVSLSSDVLPEYREYERMSTTVINAYVAPLMRQYLSGLEEGLEGRRLRIMQSNGGRISTQAACTLAAQTVLSGPAGGVVGAFQLARMAGFDQVITFDMGGTSTDVSLCPGHIQETTEGTIAGLPLRLPMIDVHTVGAGGGSIARQDTGSALLVGPQSAGVDPGPVCYGQDHAEDITVTDANLSLGRIHPEHFLGGRMILDTARTEARMLELARRLSLPMEAAAWGVIRVANSNIERAIRTISVERGYDPRYFTLVAFGGAGPLHACELAQALWIQRVLIPVHPGVLSALGMVMADTVKDYSQTVMLPAETVGTEALGRLFIPLYERAHSELMAEGLTTDDLTLEPALDMRYVGQSYELTIPFTQQSTDLRETAEGGHIRQFHAAHRRRFSYATEGEPVEIVNLRLKAIGRTDKPRFLHLSAGNLDPSPAKLGYKQVFFGDVDSPAAARPFPAALYERERLTPGNVVVGPAIIHQLDTTTAIPPGWAATVDGWRNLVIERRGS